MADDVPIPLENVAAIGVPPQNPLVPGALDLAVIPIIERKRFDRDTCIAVGPLYVAVTAECQESIDFTSDIVDDFTTAKGEIFACQKSAIVPAEEIEIHTFIMWTNERTVGPEKANADFASSCNWVFGFIKEIQQGKCLVLIIGQLFIDEDRPLTKTGHYILITPANFIVPAGVNRDSAKILLSDFETNDPNKATRTQANKRQRIQPPLISRGSNIYQGESSIHLQDIDGNYHYTREKKDASKREKELGPIWRLVGGREKEIMGKDCILQISEYKQHIIDASICQVKDDTSEYSNSSLICLIATHPVVKDDKFLKMFLTANFGPNSATSILFGSFLQKQFTPGSLPTFSARREFTNAASSFEVAARVFYSKEFLHVMDPILLILSGPLDTLSLVSDDLLLWTIERTFNKWGKTIRTEAESTEFPTILLVAPQGCANLLTSMLEADLNSLNGESLFLRERYYRTSIAAQTIDTTASNKSVVDKEKQKVTTDSTYCRFHIAYLLNAKLKDGTKMSPCKRGKDCRSTHASLNSITKSTAILLAGKLNPTLRETVLERIEEMSNKFKK